MALFDGLAAYLANAGIGTYRGDGSVYQLGEVGFFAEAMPQEPDDAVVLTVYPGTEPDPLNPWDEPRIQVRSRGFRDPSFSRGLCQQIYNQLQGLTDVTLPDGTFLSSVFAVESRAEPLGRDENNRWEHAQNYQLVVDNPTVHR